MGVKLEALENDSAFRSSVNVMWADHYNLSPDNIYRTAPSISSGEFLDVLFSEAGHFETIYASEEELEKHFHIWIRRNETRWNNIYSTMCYQYNPINNYDRSETFTEKIIGKSDVSVNGNSSANGTQTSKVSAFNEDDFTDREQVIDSNSGTSKQDSNANNTQDITRTIKVGGNIGVTTTQEMLEAERKLWRFDFLMMIVEEYKKRFCIMVY